jgi:hypothetical protein
MNKLVRVIFFSIAATSSSPRSCRPSKLRVNMPKRDGKGEGLVRHRFPAGRCLASLDPARENSDTICGRLEKRTDARRVTVNHPIDSAQSFLPGYFSKSTRIGRSVAPPRIRPSSDGGKQRHDGRAQAAIKRPVFMKIQCIVSESIQQADHGKHHPRHLPGKRRANRDAEDGSQDRSVQQNGYIHFEVSRYRSSGVSLP